LATTAKQAVFSARRFMALQRQQAGWSCILMVSSISAICCDARAGCYGGLGFPTDSATLNSAMVRFTTAAPFVGGAAGHAGGTAILAVCLHIGHRLGS